jgi:glycine/D-amino acid oxidase-like deaminating enzyme
VNPYWLEGPSPARALTRLEGRADVAIVGAGVTGCSAALRLAEAGLRAAAFWRWTHEALDRMAELAGEALARHGSYRLAGDEEEREGIGLEVRGAAPGGASGHFHGAISHPHDGSIQPARFVRRLAALAAAEERSSASTRRSRT